MDRVDLKDIGYLLNSSLAFGSYYELFPQLLFTRKPAVRLEDLGQNEPIYTQTFTSEDLLGDAGKDLTELETNLITRVPKFYLNTVVQAQLEPEEPVQDTQSDSTKPPAPATVRL